MDSKPPKRGAARELQRILFGLAAATPAIIVPVLGLRAWELITGSPAHWSGYTAAGVLAVLLPCFMFLAVYGEGE